MKIGFDVSQFGPEKAGCGNYASLLLESIKNTEIIDYINYFNTFGDFYFDRRLSLLPINEHKLSFSNLTKNHFSKSKATDFWTKNDLQDHLLDFDIVHSNNYWCPKNIYKTKIIYTLYDLSFFINPSWTTEENRIGCSNGVITASSEADWIIAISDSTKKDFLDYFPHYPEERIRIIYPYSRFKHSNVNLKNNNRFLNDKKLLNGFILSVGTIEPRKNHLFLLESYRKYLDICQQKYPLILAGNKGWLMDNFHAEIDRLGISENVIITNYVADDELSWLYSNCLLNIYPSLYEGFGLPVLEGIAHSAPTLTTDVSSMPEILPSNECLINPYDTSQCADKIHQIVNNNIYRQSIIDYGISRVFKFSKENCKNQLIDLYFEAIKSPKIVFK